MKILYVHGFGSKFDQTSEKVKALKTIGDVSGVDVDYCEEINIVTEQIRSEIFENEIDLLVGTSMGGYFSALLGSSCGVPFVAINPVTSPQDSLNKYVGEGTSYFGTKYFLSKEIIASYDPIVVGRGACGLILLDKDDEVLDSIKTYEMLSPFYRVKMYEGGCHRFSHINEGLKEICAFYELAGTIYGLDET